MRQWWDTSHGRLGNRTAAAGSGQGRQPCPPPGLDPQCPNDHSQKAHRQGTFFLSVGGLAQVTATGYPMGVGDRGRERGPEGAQGQVEACASAGVGEEDSGGEASAPCPVSPPRVVPGCWQGLLASSSTECRELVSSSPGGRWPSGWPLALRMAAGPQDGSFSGLISCSTSRMNRKHNSSCQGRATHCTATGSPTLFFMAFFSTLSQMSPK